MKIDWNKELECKVWGDDTKLIHAPHDWTSVKKVKDSSYSDTKTITLENGIYWHAKKDGSIHSYKSKVGQVRNKRNVADNQPTMTIKKDNRAVFYFEKKGDVYTLTGWKNVMSGSGIIRKYGQDVYRAYIGDYNQQSFIHEIYTTLPCDVFLRVHENKSFVLESGDVFSKEDYELIVDSCKKAGERLSKLVRDSKKPEKIEVAI
jgi:hypothetical protein